MPPRSDIDARERNKAMGLAREDPAAALRCARAITDPWYRCQAISAIARWSPDCPRLTRAAIDAAESQSDPYRAAAACAWPIRALLERDEAELARAPVERASDRLPMIAHAGSRAEAALLLFQATLIGPRHLWGRFGEALLDVPGPPFHWRHLRALRDVLTMTHVHDPTLAAAWLARVADDRTRLRAQREIAGGARPQPRAFF